MGDGVNIAASHFLIQAASSASAPPFRGAHPLRTFGLLGRVLNCPEGALILYDM